jgi:hypothetical protein
VSPRGCGVLSSFRFVLTTTPLGTHRFQRAGVGKGELIGIRPSRSRLACAENLLASVIEKTHRRYPNMEDADITRTLTMAQKYRSQIRKYNQQWDAPSDR